MDIEKLIKMYWPYVLGLVIIAAVVMPLKNLFSTSVEGLINLGNDKRKKEFDDKIESGIKNVSVDATQIRKDISYYRSIANRMYEAMQDLQPFFVDHFEDADWKELESLNSAELRLVVKEFGIKEKSTWGGLNVEITGSLIDWFADDLSGSELTRMKSIFSKTGLW